MSDALDLINRARVLRRRLLSPPNAVPDLGIDLRRHRKPAVATTPMQKALPPSLMIMLKKPEGPPRRRGYSNITHIIAASAQHFGVPKKAIMSAKRTMRLVFARQVACYLCRDITKRSFPDIGRRLGGRDHTTVLYSYRKIRDLIATSEIVAEHVRAVRMIYERDSIGPTVPAIDQPDMADGAGPHLPEPGIRSVEEGVRGVLAGSAPEALPDNSGGLLAQGPAGEAIQAKDGPG